MQWMKNYKNFNMKKNLILIIIISWFFTGCNKSLDTTIYSNLTTSNSFKTKADAVAAVNAVYARLKGPAVGDNFDYWTVRHFALTDLPTDVGHCQYGGDPGQLSAGVWNASNGLIAEDWRQIYKLIANANNAILNISNMPTTAITDAEKKQFLSEVKFLRAVAYSDLIELWGPVILVTEEDVAKADNAAYLSKPAPAPIAKIDSLLISDLENSANVLPLNYVNSPFYNSNDVGRATKGSALTLLAKLYLREKNWQKVVDVTKQVMDLNVYSLYPSYAGLFLESNKWCQENIFSVLSDENVNGTELLNHFGPQNHPTLTDRWDYYAVPWDFYHTYSDQDDRKKMFFTYFKGSDGLIYMEAPSPGAVAPPGYSYMPDVATRKYADSTRQNDTYYDGHSVDILRYADVLLSRAEALNEITPVSPEAITLINEVKGRSHAPLLVGSNFNQSTLRDAILQERGWELYYEGKRRADLIRMDKYDVIENAHLVRIGLPASIVMPKNKYFPYPQNQVNINPNLDNSGR